MELRVNGTRDRGGKNPCYQYCRRSSLLSMSIVSVPSALSVTFRSSRHTVQGPFMSEIPKLAQPRHSLFERMRGPMTLLMIAVGGFALYYSLFFERKTSYFRDRNARLVSTVADQVRRSIRSAAGMVTNAATMSESERELKQLYRVERGVAEEQRETQAMFDVWSSPTRRRAQDRRFRDTTMGVNLGSKAARESRSPMRPSSFPHRPPARSPPGRNATSRRPYRWRV